MKIDEIKNITVVGAGSMGHSIAQVYAQSGFEVDLIDLNEDALNRAMRLIKSNLNVLREFDRVDINTIPFILEHIHPSTNLQGAAKKADLIIEAVSEIPELKMKIFSVLEEYCSESTILASNTSTLDIYKILKEIKNPKRLITHHWFAPPHIIPLVEIAPGRKTSVDVVNLSIEIMEKLGKKPIVMKKFTPHYIVNRIQNAISAVMYELILRDIATAEQIDLAIKISLGIRLPIVGIVQSQDFTGLDLVKDIQKSMGIKVSIIDEKVEKGHLGAKTGKGFYNYNGQSEEEILQKRDRFYLKMLNYLEKINAFEPI